VAEFTPNEEVAAVKPAVLNGREVHAKGKVAIPGSSPVLFGVPILCVKFEEASRIAKMPNRDEMQSSLAQNQGR
jgi:hypothetical protein